MEDFQQGEIVIWESKNKKKRTVLRQIPPLETVQGQGGEQTHKKRRRRKRRSKTQLHTWNQQK